MNAIELFAGIGGFRLGLENNNISVIWANEWDKYASDTYDKNFAEAGHKIDRSDITTVDARIIPDHDLLVGGFPCQAFSVAGKRRGFLDETRGTLFFDVARILKHKRPGHFILENVKGLLSHDTGKTFQTILGVLSDLGYRVEWQVLNSKDFGVPQNRERVYIIGHLGERCGRKIFPIFGQNGSAPQPGDDGARGSEKFIKTRHLSQNGGLISDSITLQASEIPHVIGTINRGKFKETSGRSLTITANYWKGPDNHGQRPMVKTVNYNRKDGLGKEIDIAGTLSSTDYRGLNRNQNQPAVIQIGQMYDNPHNSQAGRIYDKEGISPTLDVMAGGNRQPKIMVREATKTGYAEANVGDGINLGAANSGTRRGRVQPAASQTLNTSGDVGTFDGNRIRRLTPVECERLQGFPDNWTEGVSDTQRYKQCGNAVTVNVVAAVAERLRSHL